jgi:hypothetical protein
MASTENHTTMDSNEKQTPPMEEEIQIVPFAENTGLDKANLEVETASTKSDHQSEVNPGETAEIEEGTTLATSAEPEYPTGIRFVLLTISLMLGVFMVALDTQIICEFSPPSPA